MIGLLYIWVGITIAGIMVILAIQYEHKLFGIIFFLLWPITFPIYYFMKESKRGKK